MTICSTGALRSLQPEKLFVVTVGQKSGLGGEQQACFT